MTRPSSGTQPATSNETAPEGTPPSRTADRASCGRTPGPRDWLRRIAPLVLLAAAVCAVAAWWPHIRNEVFVIFGNRDEAGGYYGWWSGFGGALQVFTLTIGAAAAWYHHTCHNSPWCLRWGKYEAAGGLFRLCRHHHPDLQGTRPHADLIHQMHAEHKART